MAVETKEQETGNKEDTRRVLLSIDDLHVWFELRRMVPFVHLTEWLAAGGTAYTDPTPHYPAMVPLLRTGPGLKASGGGLLRPSAVIM